MLSQYNMISKLFQWMTSQNYEFPFTVAHKFKYYLYTDDYVR